MPTFKRPSSVTHQTRSFAGHVRDGSVNPGIDYGAGTGTDVVAPAAGKIFRARWSSTVGYYLVIHHSNGWSSDLLHNSKLLVKEGATVTAGQHIAESGGTGSVATGPHIHWSLRPNQKGILQNYGNVDGEKYVAKATPTDTFVTWLTVSYVKKLESALGLTANGAVSTTDIKALQKKIGTTQDGKFGGNSAKALQKFIGAAQDGVVGKNTIAAWKKAIDAGKFGVVTAPPVPTDVTRKTGTKVVNVRPAPSTKSAATMQAKANTNYVVVAWTKGEAVSGNAVWYKLKNGSYAWSGGFTTQATTNLTEEKAPTPPTPTAPTQAQYDAVVTERDTARAEVTTLTAALAKVNAVIAAIKKALA